MLMYARLFGTNVLRGACFMLISETIVAIFKFYPKMFVFRPLHSHDFYPEDYVCFGPFIHGIIHANSCVFVCGSCFLAFVVIASPPPTGRPVPKESPSALDGSKYVSLRCGKGGSWVGVMMSQVALGVCYRVILGVFSVLI